MDGKYDVVIIGAGIGGLVCGSYLAKSGMKVLIVEQHTKPGGYCTSFSRGKFEFDAVIRGLVSCGEGRAFNKVCKELDLLREIDLLRMPIFDIIQTPDYRIEVRDNYKETKELLKKSLPSSSEEIERFFLLFEHFNFLEQYLKLKNKSFQNLLDEYFSDRKIKAFWNILRVDFGLSPTKTTALAGLMLCREYILDGGYYPKGGMQNLADVIAKKFQSLGGEILYRHKVNEIKLNKKKASGIALEDGTFFGANYVVSNADACQTYFELLKPQSFEKKYINRIKNMLPSPSVFVVYLGLNTKISKSLGNCCSFWNFPHYLSNKDYDLVNTQKLDDSDYVICGFSPMLDANRSQDKEGIFLYVGAPFKNEHFWNKHKESYSENIIERGVKIFPDLKKHIILKEVATPATLYRYTLNKGGASRGWACLSSQTDWRLITKETSIGGLYLVGHWTTSPIGNGGVAMVGALGRNVAKSIINSIKK